jgi:hypothetical protein
MKLRFCPTQHLQRQRQAAPGWIELEIEAAKARVEQYKTNQCGLLLFPYAHNLCGIKIRQHME